jgi:hypothetical protein
MTSRENHTDDSKDNCDRDVYEDPFAVDETSDGYDRRTHHVILVDIHIVYCTVFKVPTLMFKFSSPDGSPITMEAAGFTPPADDNESWPSVTLQEHPVVPDMLYTFHACQTAEKLHTMLVSHLDKNMVVPSHLVTFYLLCWFQLVAPFFNIQIPCRFYQAVASYYLEGE